MANLKWSWVFSDEDDDTRRLLGWSFDSFLTGKSNTYVYSYPGDPMRAAGLRYSVWARDGEPIDGPSGKAATSGSLSVPVYFTANPTTAAYLLYVEEGGTTTKISVRPTSPTSLGLYINGVQKEDIAGLNLNGYWNYITIKYDMSVNPWSASLYINENGTGVTHTEALTAAADTTFSFEGAAGPNGSYFGQVVLYSDWVDTEKIRYVSRVNPSLDTSESGSWIPSSGTDNFAVISGSFSTSSYCANTASLSGENIVCQVTGALGLITQLGMAPPSIDGVTVHCWASGSGQQAVPGVSDNNSVYTTGSAITPSSSPTYGYVSVSSQPSDSAVWNATSSLYIKYEVV